MRMRDLTVKEESKTATICFPVNDTTNTRSGVREFPTNKADQRLSAGLMNDFYGGSGRRLFNDL